MATYKLHERIKGPMANNEDWWHLEVDDKTGEKRVVHEWSHVSISNFANQNSGEKSFTVDEFRASSEHPDAKARLEEILLEIG
jgi:hypothetical protein